LSGLSGLGLTSALRPRRDSIASQKPANTTTAAISAAIGASGCARS
jgi:hypothetical protein